MKIFISKPSRCYISGQLSTNNYDWYRKESGTKPPVTILTGKMDDCNTFENPEVVKLADFNDYSLTEEGIKFTIPACSILHLEVK